MQHIYTWLIILIASFKKHILWWENLETSWKLSQLYAFMTGWDRKWPQEFCQTILLFTYQIVWIYYLTWNNSSDQLYYTSYNGLARCSISKLILTWWLVRWLGSLNSLLGLEHYHSIQIKICIFIILQHHCSTFFVAKIQ